jgi:hypothetical protein
MLDRRRSLYRHDRHQARIRQKKIEENCGGMGVIERSSFCRAKISFALESV